MFGKPLLASNYPQTYSYDDAIKAGSSADLCLTGKAGINPLYTPLAMANMTGANGYLLDWAGRWFSFFSFF